jgi:hypothetical protein
MYSNSLKRIGLLLKIEWSKRGKVIISSILAYMVFMMVSVMIPAQYLDMSRNFFPTHLILGLVLLTGWQIANLFPEWNNHFQTCQLLQLPARPIEKYLVRLSFPFLVVPVLFLGTFWLFRPVCLYLCMAITGFEIYPFYPSEIRIMSIVIPWTLFMILPLFIPGSILFKRGHLIKSTAIYIALFIGLATISSLLGLPAFSGSTYNDGSIGAIIGAQFESIGTFIKAYNSIAKPIWMGAVVPLALVSGYWLFKQQEA